MDRRDFIKGAAVTVAAIGAGGTLNAIEAEPAIAEATSRLTSITLPAAYIGKSFTIINTGNLPITVTRGPTEVILHPGAKLVAPQYIVKFR